MRGRITTGIPFPGGYLIDPPLHYRDTLSVIAKSPAVDFTYDTIGP